MYNQQYIEFSDTEFSSKFFLPRRQCYHLELKDDISQREYTFTKKGQDTEHIFALIFLRSSVHKLIIAPHWARLPEN